MPQGRVGDTINALPSPWAPLPPTFPDGVRQELSNFTAVVAPEVVGEHYDETDTRNTEVPGRAREVCLAQVLQRSRTLSWHSESDTGE